MKLGLRIGGAWNSSCTGDAPQDEDGDALPGKPPTKRTVLPGSSARGVTSYAEDVKDWNQSMGVTREAHPVLTGEDLRENLVGEIIMVKYFKNTI